jgi:hypothetical protein
MSRKKLSPRAKKKDHVILESNKIVPFRDKIKTKMAAMNDRFQIKKRELLKKNSFIQEPRTFFNLYWKKLGGDFLNNVKNFLVFSSSWFWRISVFLLGLSDEGATFWERTPWILQIVQSLFSTVIAVFFLYSFVAYVPVFIKNYRKFSFSSFFIYDFEKDIRHNGFRSNWIRRFCRVWDWTFINLSRLAINALIIFLHAIFNFEASLKDHTVKDLNGYEIWGLYLRLLRDAGIYILMGQEEIAKKEKKKKEDQKKEEEDQKKKKDNQKKKEEEDQKKDNQKKE